MPEPIGDLQYHYPKRNELLYSEFLATLERELGGTRQPWGVAGSGIDLVSIFEITLSIAAGYFLKPVITEYAKGLFAADKAKQLGEQHRTSAMSALGLGWNSLKRLTNGLKRSLTAAPKELMTGKEAIVLVVSYDRVFGHFVLNPYGEDPDLIDALPDGILNLGLLCSSGVLPTETRSVQMWFDRQTKTWRFAFIPTGRVRFAEITQDALRLPHDEQLRLARTFLERSEGTGQAEVDGAWEEEVERRIRNIDAGLAKSRPFAEVVAEIDRQLGR